MVSARYKQETVVVKGKEVTKGELYCTKRLFVSTNKSFLFPNRQANGCNRRPLAWQDTQCGHLRHLHVGGEYGLGKL